MPPKSESGFTLLELMIASVILLGAILATFGAITASNRVLQRHEQLAGVSNIERIAQSYLRDLGYGLLQNSTVASLTTGIRRQLSSNDLNELGATGSVSVTALTQQPKLIQIDLLVTYGTGQFATTSVRVAQRGVSP